MTDPAGHLDLDALADVLAGERDDPHLRTCGPCTDRLAELAAADATVRAALGALPPPPVPAGLSLRLTQALQQERRRETAAVRGRTRRGVPAWLPAAAASVVLVAAGAAGWSQLGPSGQGSGDEASSDAVAGGSGQDPALEAAPEAAPEAGPGTGPEVASGLALPGAVTDWADAAARPAALSRLLAAADPSASSATAVPPGDALDRLRDPAALAACLGALPGGGRDDDDEVLAVDYARYAGAPAVAVVQPADPGLVEVVVVGAGCSAGDPELLDVAVLPRP